MIRARHYPSECIEFSVWKDPSGPDVAHLHAVRASFGHFYPWIRVDRLGMPVGLAQLDELNDLHVFIRPIFMEIASLLELNQADRNSQPVDSDPRVDMSKGCTNCMQMSSIGIRRVLPHAEFDAFRRVVSSADYQFISRYSEL